jgi:uncharacterized protein with PQ loop repeat
LIDYGKIKELMTHKIQGAATHHPKHKRTTKTVDAMAYIVGIGGNIAVIPQIIAAWSGPAPGLAVLTWLLFVAVGLIWLAYAILHQQKPLIVAQLANMLCNLLVVIGWMVHNL